MIVNDDLPKAQPIEPLPAPWAKPPPPTEPVPFPTKPVVPAPPQPPPAPAPPGKPVPPIAPAPPFATLATLTVTVKVVNDDGGTAVPSNFGVLITGVDVVDGTPNFPGSSSGTRRTVTPGAYAVQQSTLAGYSTSYSAGCRASVGQGGAAACAIVDNDVAPGGPNPPAPPQPPPPGPPGGETTTITVITVVRNAGGALTPASFVDLISGTPVVSGTPVFRGAGTQVLRAPLSRGATGSSRTSG